MNLSGRDTYMRLGTAVLLALATAACATHTPPPVNPAMAAAERKAANDPLERMNRATFAFDEGLDRIVLRPVTKGWRSVAPQPVRTGLGHALRNLGEPYTAMNDILQGKPARAAAAVWRFVVNSTVGIGGIFDVAKKAKVPYHYEDFGQTLAVWGVKDGPYLVLPFFGPSNFRDGVGFGVDWFSDPVVWKEHDVGGRVLSTGIVAAKGVDTRDRQFDTIDDLFKRPDPYAAARSAWRQNRNFEIHDGKVVETKEEEDLFDTPEQ